MQVCAWQKCKLWGLRIEHRVSVKQYLAGTHTMFSDFLRQWRKSENLIHRMNMCVAWIRWGLRDTDMIMWTYWIRMYVTLMYLLRAHWHDCLIRSASTWIWFLRACRSLTSSPWSYSIRMYVNLILTRAYCRPTYSPWLSLDQKIVCEPVLLELIGDWHSRRRLFVNMIY